MGSFSKFFYFTEIVIGDLFSVKTSIHNGFVLVEGVTLNPLQSFYPSRVSLRNLIAVLYFSAFLVICV